MSNRVDPYINLPVDMDPHLRQSLVDVLRRHAVQINWATGQDTQPLTSSGTVAYDVVTANASAGAVSCTLPPAADWYDRTIRIKKMDGSGNLVKVLAQSGETIDGTATVGISVQYTCLQLMSTGTAWVIV